MPAVDNYGQHKIELQAPSGSFAAITKSDSVDLAFVTRGVYVGGSGDVVAVSPAGDVVTFSNVAAGTVLPIRVTRINSTSTTATGMVALF